jgi:hypothetical protein
MIGWISLLSQIEQWTTVSQCHNSFQFNLDLLNADNRSAGILITVIGQLGYVWIRQYHNHIDAIV